KEAMRSPNGVLDGDTYTALRLQLRDDGKPNANAIGLRFLARHLVTLDFPHRTMYLKRTSVGPLPVPPSDTAVSFLKSLKEGGGLPGWSKNDDGQVLSGLFGDDYPASGTLDIQKAGDSSVYHYTLFRATKESPWELKKAWRTNKKGHTIETYPRP